ncbi:MAG: class I SAM-dependent methyltransferase [Candidatus Diapherotrites archaeon]
MGVQVGILSNFLLRQRNSLAAKYVKGKMLDVGCNEGEFRKFILPNTNYFGIDINPKPKKVNFPFKQLSVENNLEQLGKFDSVTLIALIEHLKKPEKAIKNVHKILNKKGRIIITTPSKIGDKIHSITSTIGLVSKFAAEDHQKIFSLEELEFLLKNQGFKIIESKTFFFGLNLLVVGEIE